MIINQPGKIRTNGPIGENEIWTLKWLEEKHPGYGPHTFTTYKFFLNRDAIHAKRIYELNESNGDPRENLIENHASSLPAYLVDEDPEFTLIKQAFEGLPQTPSSLESPEQQREAIKRFFGGDPEETTLGLHDLSQIAAEEVRKLLFTAEPTRDPILNYKIVPSFLRHGPPN